MIFSKDWETKVQQTKIHKLKSPNLTILEIKALGNHFYIRAGNFESTNCLNLSSKFPQCYTCHLSSLSGMFLSGISLSSKDCFEKTYERQFRSNYLKQQIVAKSPANWTPFILAIFRLQPGWNEVGPWFQAISCQSKEKNVNFLDR